MPRWLLPACLVVVALTRLLFWPSDAIGWDEALFLGALDSFDMRAGFPHPPGYPYYVLAGKAVYAVVGSGPVALSLIGLVGALAGCFGIYRLALWLHGDQGLAVASMLFWAFIPATWLYHGALFSDGPGLGLSLLALGSLATGCRGSNRREVLIAALLTALALGIRPPLITLLSVPWVLATVVLLRRRQLRTWWTAIMVLVLGCLPIPLIIVLNMGSMGAARDLFTSHGEWWLEADTLPLPGTFSGWLNVMQVWYVDAFGYAWSGMASIVLALVGVVLGLYTDMRHRILCCLAVGATYAVISLLQLNMHSAGRYSLPIQAGVALALPLSLLRLAPQVRPWACGVGTSVFVASFMVWSSPVLQLLRSERPPLAAAIDFLARYQEPSKRSVVVDWQASAYARRRLADVPRFAERKIPFLPRWWEYLQGQPDLPGFFEGDRRLLRLTLASRPGEQPLFAKTWSSERMQRLRGFHYHDAAYVYSHPARVLRAAGFVENDLDGEEVVDVAMSKALLLIAPDVSELSAEVRPAGGQTMTLDVSLFAEEDWRRPQTIPKPVMSLEVAGDTWTRLRCRIESPTTLPARACVLMLRSPDGKEMKSARLYVRRWHTE